MALFITGAAIAVAGVAVAVGVGVGMSESGKASAQAMVDCARLKAKGDLDGICRQQDTEDRRIKSEKNQADDWLKFDEKQAARDEKEALAFQQKLDQSMGVYQDERNIQKSNFNTNNFNNTNRMAVADHEYPPLDSNQGGGGGGKAA